MRYRTVIEIITKANSKTEATDIAGEFLKGNFDDDVKFKFYTQPLRSHIFFKTSLLVVLISIFAGVASFGYFRGNDSSNLRSESTYAFQPPLKTGIPADFKDEWQREGAGRILKDISE